MQKMYDYYNNNLCSLVRKGKLNSYRLTATTQWHMKNNVNKDTIKTIRLKQGVRHKYNKVGDLKKKCKQINKSMLGNNVL